MGALSKVLRSVEGGRLSFFCPGCKNAHCVAVGDGDGPRWNYNGFPDKPTFTPSILIRTGHYVPGHEAGGEGCWCKYNAECVAAGEEASGFNCGVCHSFVTDGQIQFLSDCTHDLAGQTVPLPENWWEKNSGAG